MQKVTLLIFLLFSCNEPESMEQIVCANSCALWQEEGRGSQNFVHCFDKNGIKNIYFLDKDGSLSPLRTEDIVYLINWNITNDSIFDLGKKLKIGYLTHDSMFLYGKDFNIKFVNVSNKYTVSNCDCKQVDAKIKK